MSPIGAIYVIVFRHSPFLGSTRDESSRLLLIKPTESIVNLLFIVFKSQLVCSGSVTAVCGGLRRCQVLEYRCAAR